MPSTEKKKLILNVTIDFFFYLIKNAGNCVLSQKVIFILETKL